MVKRNPNLAKLQAGYLFPEINRRKQEALKRNPGARIISLGIGNTTEPLTPHVIAGLTEAVADLGTREKYSGYGDEQGLPELREKIATTIYQGLVEADEVFVSDGSKCDIGRLQLLFGADVTIAVQDPSYPVYVDGSVLAGATGLYNEENENFDGIVYMACTAENGFFPDLEKLPRTDLIYLCSPNNPTGAAAGRDELARWVEYARANGSIILFDAAYEAYVSDPAIPRSIYEIPGARDVAIEFRSFSKTAGFTGTRCAFTVVPKSVMAEAGGERVAVNALWNRRQTTKFNGVSYPVQRGAAAVYSPEGREQTRDIVRFYMENAAIIRKGLAAAGFTVFGGTNAPYIWLRTPAGLSSWDFFDRLLSQANVVGTPGSGFGPSGEGYLAFLLLVIAALRAISDLFKGVNFFSFLSK